MRKLKLYLDTSIFNFMFADDVPELKKITEDFFENIEKYDIYISEVVIHEISKVKDIEKRNKLLGLIEKYHPILLGTEKIEEVAKLAQCYLDDKIIPEVKREDAEHIAYAVVYGIDILVSWNYEHLANVNKENKINLVNQKEGYFYPFRMVTPLGVISDED